MTRRGHHADSHTYGYDLTHRLNLAHSRLTRHPGPGTLLLGPPTLAASGSLLAGITGNPVATHSGTAAAILLLAFAAVQYDLRQRYHLPRLVAWAVHRRNLRRGHGNLHTLHLVAQTACEAADHLRDADHHPSDRHAAAVTVRAAQRLHDRLDLDLDDTIRRIAPPDPTAQRDDCCPAHQRLPVPLTLADTRTALALSGPAQAALRSALGRGTTSGPLTAETARHAVRTVARVDATGQADTYLQTVHALADTWQGSVEDLLRTSALITYGETDPDAASHEPTAAR